MKFILQGQDFADLEEEKQYDSQGEDAVLDNEIIPHSPFTSLEKEISKYNPSAISEMGSY